MISSSHKDSWQLSCSLPCSLLWQWPGLELRRGMLCKERRDSLDGSNLEKNYLLHFGRLFRRKEQKHNLSTQTAGKSRDGDKTLFPLSGTVWLGVVCSVFLSVFRKKKRPITQACTCHWPPFSCRSTRQWCSMVRVERLESHNTVIWSVELKLSLLLTGIGHKH